MIKPLILATALLAPAAALAEDPPCFPQSSIEGALNAAGQRPVAIMASSAAYVVKILSKPDGSHFTMLAILSDGRACILTQGTHLRFLVERR